MPISSARSNATWPAEWPGMPLLVATIKALIGALRKAGVRPAAKASPVTSSSGATSDAPSMRRSAVAARLNTVPTSAPRTRSQPAPSVEPVSGRNDR